MSNGILSDRVHVHGSHRNEDAVPSCGFDVYLVKSHAPTSNDAQIGCRFVKGIRIEGRAGDGRNNALGVFGMELFLFEDELAVFRQVFHALLPLGRGEFIVVKLSRYEDLVFHFIPLSHKCLCCLLKAFNTLWQGRGLKRACENRVAMLGW